MSVAERVAAERAEILGSSVGYSVRFDTVLPRSHASMLFCTVGKLVLLEFLSSFSPTVQKYYFLLRRAFFLVLSLEFYNKNIHTLSVRVTVSKPGAISCLKSHCPSFFSSKGERQNLQDCN